MIESRFGWKASDLRLVKPVAKSSIHFAPFAVMKGDYVGHPFRGNQWTDASGVSRQGAMSGADRPNSIPNLQGVDTVEEARAKGRPLKMLQPEHYPPKVKAALAAHQQAQDAINALHKEIVGEPETEEATKRFLADRRVQVAELALQLALDEARVQLSAELAKTYGFTVESDPEAPIERIPYENVWRDGDGRLKREEAYFFPSKFAEGYRWSGTGTPLAMLNPDGSYRLVFRNEWEEQKLGYDSLHGIPVDSLRTGKPPFSSYDATGKPDRPQQDQKAVDAARQILVKEAKDLGIDLPETTQPPRLSAKALKGTMSDDEIGVLGSHIWETAKRAVDSKTKEIDSTLSFTDPKGDVTAALLAKQVRLVTDDAPLSVTVPASKVGAILKDGRLKSQFETGKSGGKNDPEIRADWEAAMFGYPRGMNPEQRPIYGMVETGGPKPSSTRGNEQYGTVTLVLKDEVKDRATFTNGDSLNMNPQHVPVRDPSSRVAQERVSRRTQVGSDNDTYYEAQIHGGVKTSDIARVIIDTRTYKDFQWQNVQPSAALLKALDKAGIPYEIVAGKNFQDPEANKSATATLAKGDYVGHPFRGNQWVDASGAQPAYAIPDNGVDFNPYSSEAKDFSEIDRRNERIEFTANAAVAFDDARQADLLRLNDLRGVGIVEVPAPADKTNPRRYRLVVRLGGYDTSLVLDSLKEHRNYDEAVKRKAKVQELLEEFVNNPTLKVRAINADTWEYEYVAQSGPNKGRTITKRASFVKPQYSQQPDVVLKSVSVVKGDYVGHPFRGNQWTDASGVGRGADRASSLRPSDKTLRTIAFEMDSKIEVLKDEGARLVKFAGGIEFVDRQAYTEQLALVSRATPNHQVIASGVTMTEEALNDEADVAVIEDRNGQICGAISMSSKPYTSQELSEFLGGVDPNSTWVEMRSAGSTMKLDGVGSGLFAAAISKAAESGSGLYLSPLDENAKQFWESKGFREAERVGSSEGTYQYLDAESVRIIADNLEEGWDS